MSNERMKQVVEWMITKEKQEPYGGIIGKYELIVLIMSNKIKFLIV